MSLFVSLTPDMDDETLFAKVERGDVEAFTVVYNKYHKLLYVLAYRYLDYVCFYRFYRKNLFPVLFLIFLRIMGGMTDSSSPPNPFQRAAKNSLFLGSNTRAEARGSFGVGE